MISALLPLLSSFRAMACRKKGQTLVEYALILAIISVVLIAVFSFFGARLILLFSAVANLLDTAQSSH
jgi:Flp pilus assembly pilin Flp